MDAFKEPTKAGKLDYTIDLAIGAEKDNSGNYHIKQNYWQSNKFVGYNDLYDDAFKAAGIINGSKPGIYKREFTMNGESYIIWAWKGNYINLGAGAELSRLRPLNLSPSQIRTCGFPAYGSSQ